MAVYKIFPEKDSFIFSDILAGNAGKDEIVEIAGYPDLAGTGQTRRILTKFSDSDITNVVVNIIGSTNFSASLNLYLAEASELPVNFTIEAFPIYVPGADWVNGVGKYGDIPTNITGVSWQYITSDGKVPWPTGSYVTGVTGSYTGNLYGGGTWYVESGSSQQFNLNSELDISLDVTDAILGYYNETLGTGSLQNNGFILKLEDSLEFNENNYIILKYFGVDTNTIYPPSLAFKWDDSSYVTGSLNVLSTSQATISLVNNRGKYTDLGKQRFRLTARPTYPTRTFVTSSVYLTNYALPEGSTWGIKDEYTNEMVVDYDSNFTRVSCDSTGPYFDVYMNGLEPERFYRLLVRTEVDGSELVVDNESIFKIVRYV